MKKKYTISLDDAQWAVLEEIARKRNFVYRGRLNPSAAIAAFIDAYMKKQSSPPKEASARDEVKQPVRKWTVAAVLAHWPEKERERYKQDEHKYKLVVERILSTINEQSP
jgi:hypothetical protein